MRHTLFALLALAGLTFASPALAQDDPAPAPEATEESAEVTDEAVAPEDKAAAPAEGEAAAPAEGEEAKDEAAPEGGEPEAEAKDEAAPAEGEEAKDEAKVPETDEEAVKTALSLLEAVKAGQWPLAVGLLLTLIVYGVNRFALKDKVDEKIIPWIAGGVGFAGAVGMGLVTSTPIPDALVAGTIAAVAAVGGWEALIKHLTAGKSAEEPKAEEPKAEEPKAE